MGRILQRLAGMAAGSSRGGRKHRAVLVGLLVGAAGCEVSAIPEHVREPGRRHRLEALGVETFHETGESGLAGVSATGRIAVERLNRRSLNGDTLSAEFRTFLARCGACHDVPDPGSKTAGQWRSSLRRMTHNQEQAGLLPMSPQQEGAVLEYLQRHARGER
jgi:hypothetical protein